MKLSNDLKKRIEKTVHEKIDIVGYNPQWITLFEEEAKNLKKKFPTIVKRIEHFGSTAIPGLSAKPVVDMLVEVTSYKEVKKKIVGVLEKEGYDYFWRPEIDKPPMYTWFIKRNKKGERTHHIHMVEATSKLWDRLHFRDYLRKFPEVAKRYEKIKKELTQKFPNDREAYTKGKTDFVLTLTKKAKKYFQKHE